MRFAEGEHTASVQGRGGSIKAWDLALGPAGWRLPVPAYGATHDDRVAIAWAEGCQRCGIPVRLTQQLIDGVTLDLDRRRYPDFESLARYCYRVAATVGLMRMDSIGYLRDEAIPYAAMQGVALRLRCILRDIGEDYRIGRLYRARDELAEFGRSETSFSRPSLSQSWRTLMGFRFAHARRLYAEAYPGMRRLSPGGKFALQAVTGLPRGILDQIERNDFDVFTRLANSPAARRARLLTGLWLSARLGNRGEARFGARRPATHDQGMGCIMWTRTATSRPPCTGWPILRRMQWLFHFSAGR